MSYKYRWDEYDQVIVGVSGGKDSTALMLWMNYESGCPHSKILYEFWDTGNEDPLLYAYIDYLSNVIAPIVTRYPPLDFWELARKKNRFPSRKARFCTQFLKILPSNEDIILKVRLGASVIKMTGVRRDEGRASNDRAQTPYCDMADVKVGKEIALIPFGNPICECSIDDVWDIHKKYLCIDEVVTLIQRDWRMSRERKDALISRMLRHRTPRNPLYDMGARRVGCFPCIFSAKNEIRGLVQYRPETIEAMRRQENAVNPKKGISTFFGKGHIPQRFCSKKITAGDGVQHMVPTIDDVAKWAMTGKRATQPMLDFDAGDINPVCQIGGQCE